MTQPQFSHLDITTEPAWRGFAPGVWNESIDVRDFIQRNYTPYDLSLIHI